MDDDAPWVFGGPFQYPVLHQGRAQGAAVQAQYSRQRGVVLTPVLDGAETVSEGAVASYTVSLATALPPGITASWRIAVIGVGADSRIDAHDFVGTSAARVAIAPGASSKSFSLTVADDDGAELTEIFELSLRDALLSGNSGNGTLEVPTTAPQTIIAANGVRQVTLASSATVAEGATATFVVRLEQAAGNAAGNALTVEYEIAAVSPGLTPTDLQGVTVTDRTGTGGVRVVALPVTGSVTLGTDGSARVSVRVADDAVASVLEDHFRLRLTRCTNCVELAVEIGVPSSLTVAIIDNDFIDYSSDGRLIDVSNVEQLHAIRWDLDGDGDPDEQAYATSYTAAFPNAESSMGCTMTCTGYALVNDIDLGASRFGRSSSSEGWQPIAGLPDRSGGFLQYTSYDGDFDGRGHVIMGLYINRPDSDRVGLFGRMGQRSPDSQHRYQNLGLLDADVTGRNWVGALAGQISTNTIVTTIYVSGGSVTGDNHVGGLAGRVEDDLIAVYASVAVSGTNGVGGLAGTYYSVGNKELTASYAAGRVTGTTNAGGLVGNRESGDTAATVNASYWDTLASGQSASALGVGTDTAALQTPTTYGGIYQNWNVDVDGVPGADDPWNFGTSMQYPVLQYGGLDVQRQRGVPLPVVFEAANYRVDESAGSVAIAVRLSAEVLASPGSVTFPITGTITALDDVSPQSRYDVSTAPVTFLLSETVTRAEVMIPVIADAIPEEEESVSLQLLPYGYSDATQTALVTIADDDEIVIGFDNPSVAVDEGSSLSACVAMTVPPAMVPLEREFSLAVESRPGTAGVLDYTPIDEALGPFGHGTRGVCLDVMTVDDQSAEPTETFQVALAMTGNLDGVVVAPSLLTIAINDYDVMDYSSDDRLIDVRTPAQLHAMRWDLNGDGMVDDPAYATSYGAAFLRPVDDRLGCATTCTGYALVNDIDLGASRFGRARSSEGWQPIGGESAAYTGDFDGRGRVITGLYIHRPASDYVGLFGYMGEGAGSDAEERSHQNLGLVDVDVTGANRVGALAGYSTNTVVTTIYAADGSVTGDDNVGGLVGFLEGDVTAAYASVSVSGRNNVGGLAGLASGHDDNDRKDVTASYAAGRVVGVGNVGGLVGNVRRNFGVGLATAVNSYWDTRRSGRNASALGVGHDTAALQMPTTYGGIYQNWNVDVDDDDNADAPWEFGTSMQYPVLQYRDFDVRRQRDALLRSVLEVPVIFEAANYTVGESSGSIALTVRLSDAALVLGTFSVAGSVTALDDVSPQSRYDVSTSPVPFALSEAVTRAELRIAIVADAIPEERESVPLRLSSVGYPRSQQTALATITDDDEITIGFERSSYAIDEGDSLSVCVTMTAPAAAVPLEREFSLAVESSAGTAGVLDYTPIDEALGPFGHSTRSVCLDVMTTEDEVVDLTKSFQIALATTGNLGGVVVAPSLLTIVINDDDVADYSSDDRLIDVRTPQQLHAMRWDLNGDGVPDDPAYATSYSDAFPAPARNMGCATTCTGYALARDVDLGASRFGRGGGGAGWLPIGAGDTGYDGDFDGRDYVVSGLYIHRPTSDHVGLFARLGEGTTERRIQNLGLINVNVTGNDYVGALAGRVSTDVVVAKVYVSSGSVVGATGVGGLAGLIGDDVLAVYASVAVSGTSAVGGLAGISSGADARRLVASYAAGRIVGGDAGRIVGGANRGGLVGRHAGTRSGDEDNYWDTSVSGLETSALSGLGIGTDTRSLQEPTTYSGIYAAWDVDVDGDGAGDDPWRFGTSFDYPVLSGSGTSVARQLLLQSQFQIALRVTGTATVAEGGVATYTVVALRAVPYPVAVAWEVGAGAGADVAAADDFRADATTTLPLAAYPAGTATIRQGATETTFSVYVLADEIPEEAEPYLVIVRVGDFGGKVTVAEESSAVAATIEFRGRNYDPDGDGLIGVETTSQLAVIRFDLNGDGVADNEEAYGTTYSLAFPLFDAALTCPAPRRMQRLRVVERRGPADS